MRMSLVAATVPVILVSSLVSAQAPQFRSDTDLVRVYATVRHATGQLQTDLTAADFTVRDRGTTVPISSFSTDVQPITVAIMVDMSGTVFERATFEQLRAGLSAFVDRLQIGDSATVGWFSRDRIFIAPQMTSDKDALKSLIESEITVERAIPGPALEGPDAHAYSVFEFRGRPLWNAIGATVPVLDGRPGRKIVLVLANGDNTRLLPTYPRLRDLRETLASGEFMVYAVHGFEPRRPDFTRDDQIMGSADERQTTLKDLTDLTGGGFRVAPFDPIKGRGAGWLGVELKKNGLSLAFRSQLADIVDELRHQYTLGFVPSKRDGKVGSIEVRVNRPNAAVWARKTYKAPNQ